MSLSFLFERKTLFLKKIMDDLTTFELEQIARLEAKCVEARHKSSQERSILAKNRVRVFKRIFGENPAYSGFSIQKLT